MGKYIDKSIQKDEKIIKEAQFNKLALLGIGIMILLCIIIFRLSLSDIMDNSYSIDDSLEAYIALILGILFIWDFIKAIIYISTSELAFTNKRILCKRGLINIKTLDSPLNKINDFNIKTSFFGKIFNYSTIFIKTSSSIYIMYYIKDAQEFKNLLTTQDIVQKVEVESSNNKYDDLEKLKKLLDNGTLTEEEFNKEKQKILSK